MWAMESLIQEARILLGFLSETDAILSLVLRHRLTDGVTIGEAFLAVKAAKILGKEL